ncbi:MAG: tetratricopeptide repeat protein [Chitinivorax sp.]
MQRWRSLAIRLAYGYAGAAIQEVDAMMRQKFLGMAVVAALLAAPAWAGFAEGKAAAEKGDHATAAKEWKAAAEKGDVGSQVALGFLYQKGLGVKQDWKQAVSWWDKAAAQGNTEAMRTAARVYLTGAPGVELDVPKSMKYYQKAAEANDPVAQLNLAQLLIKFARDDDDVKQAGYWFMRAAEQGSPAAMHNLGVMFEKGLGVPADAAEAQKWYAKEKEAKAGTKQQASAK